MKNKIMSVLLLSALVLMTQSCGESTTPEAEAETDVEGIDVVQDQKDDALNYGCYVDRATFKTWFEDKKIKANGMVNAANSLQHLDSDCDFYKWSWQMFLWATSPTITDGDYVFNSSAFFDVLPNDSLTSADGIMSSTGGFDRTAQAGPGNNVLLSQSSDFIDGGSIVHYSIHINDVYAYFQAGKENSGGDVFPNITEFPTTQDELTKIVKYAKDQGVDLNDSIALTMEMKSSWVKIDKDNPLASDYILMTADIPKYTKNADNTVWAWDGITYDKGVTMAMVGFHVTGSTFGHPEMVWATFEHKNNTPLEEYSYKNQAGDTVTYSDFGEDNYLTDAAKLVDWIFFDKSTKSNSANQIFITVALDGTLSANPIGSGNTISPSSTTATHPFGQLNSTSDIESNTLIKSLNENIQRMLKKKDARSNYFLVGATWTKDGVIPNMPGSHVQAIYEGSHTLANTTMETYVQYQDCFHCHQGGSLGGLSHIFDRIIPLTPETKTIPY